MDIRIMSNEQKPFWKSKTFWLAVITIALGVAETIQGNINSGTTLTSLGILQIVVRFLTETKLVLR